MRLGKYTKDYREKLGLTQVELADRCDVSRSYIAQLEKGTDCRSGKIFIPTLEVVAKIAKGTHTDLIWLLQNLDELQFDKSLLVTDNRIINGDNNRNCQNDNSTELDEMEKELLRIFRLLPMREKNRILTFAYETEEKV